MRQKFPVLWVVALLILIAIAYVMSENGSPSPRHLTDVGGHLPDLNFSLTDDAGKHVTAETYRGKVVLLYFGFTQCPDQCPVTLARLSAVLKILGSDADSIRILFATVDPAHDTPSVLHEFLKPFDAGRIVGLTGQESVLTELAKRYRAAYQPSPERADIVHSDAIYIFDVAGHARLLATGTDTEQNLTDDLRRLVHDIR